MLWPNIRFACYYISSIQAGSTPVKADTTFILSDENFIATATGKTNPQVAFMSGKLKLQVSHAYTNGTKAKFYLDNLNVIKDSQLCFVPIVLQFV